MILEIQGPVTPAQKTDLESIRDNGQRLLLLINDLLDVSQIETGQMPLDIETIDLRHEILCAVEHSQGKINERALQVEIDLPDGLPLIQADPRRIYQLVCNLLSNAIKFTPAGKVSISATYSNQWVVVNVADSGIGIPIEDLERIFHPFTQVDESTTRKYEGAGLGLTIARYIVDLHGGKIWVESEPGAGTIISFVLPIRRETRSIGRLSAIRPDVSPGIRVQVDTTAPSLQES